MVGAIRRALDDMARRSEALTAAAATPGARLHDRAVALDAARGSGEAPGAAVDRIGAAGDAARESEAVAKATTAAASRRFEEGVRRGLVTLEALVSRDCEPIPGTDPAQFMAPFVAFTDAAAPALPEDALRLGRRVAFAAAVDVDGFPPTHDRMFSPPQAPDPVWNAAHCRNRRYVADRAGLAAGRSTAPLLLQAYLRDIDGGRVVTMEDASAPKPRR